MRIVSTYQQSIALDYCVGHHSEVDLTGVAMYVDRKKGGKLCVSLKSLAARRRALRRLVPCFEDYVLCKKKMVNHSASNEYRRKLIADRNNGVSSYEESNLQTIKII